MTFSEPLIEHAWNLDAADVIFMQKNFAGEVNTHDCPKAARYIAADE
jgi:hypothetical protein